jgi:ribosome maturation factor RimP
MSEDVRRNAPQPSRAADREFPGRDARSRGPNPQYGGRTRKGGRGPGHDGQPADSAGRPSQASIAAGDGSRRPPSTLGTIDVARLTRLLEPVLAALELDLEAIKLSSAGRRRVLRIIVDADGGVSLDDIAEVSREVSAKLDAHDAMGDAPYTLEVSSPGIDRPLTEPRHWRRAAGRLVAVQLIAGKHHRLPDPAGGAGTLTGRVIGADQNTVTLEMEGIRRTFGHAELGPGRVQVEFGRLTEAGDADIDDQAWPGEAKENDNYLEDADSAAGGGADEEEPRGH